MWIIHERRAACGQTEEHPTTGQREAPDGYPRGHADEPTGALGPRRRKPRTDTPGGYHREHPTAPAEGGVRDTGTPASGTGRAVERHRHCWYCCADARYWHRRALSTTCMGYQHRRALYPPRGVNNPLTMSTTPSRCQQRAPVRDALEHPVLETRPPLTTRARARRATALRAHWANPPVWCPSPPGYAHKDPDLRNTRCTQRLDSALVCDPVFPNSLPCVRPRGGRADNGGAPRPVNPRPRQFQPRPRA